MIMMVNRKHPADSHGRSIRRRGFTITELLVVMGVIALLSALTAVSYRAIAKDAKLASGKNTVTAVLDNARGLAMKNNQIVMVVFRPRLEGTRSQYLEAVIARYSGQTATAFVTGSSSGYRVVDRFAPIPNVPARALPVGIKVAGPSYSSDATLGDDKWFVPSHLPAMNGTQGEIGGPMIAIMYAPDGSTITRNSATDSDRMWVDFDNDGLQRILGAPCSYTPQGQLTPIQGVDYFGTYCALTSPYYSPSIPESSFNGLYFEQRTENDETFVDVAPFLAVFDDDGCRESYDTSKWVIGQPGADTARRNDYTEFITSNADRIHFNRYTGVAMK